MRDRAPASSAPTSAADAGPGSGAGKRALTDGMAGPASASIGGLLGEPAAAGGAPGAGGGGAAGDDPFGMHLLGGNPATLATPSGALAQAAAIDGARGGGAMGEAMGVPGVPVIGGAATRGLLGELGVRGAASGGRAFVADDDPHVLAHELAHVAQGGAVAGTAAGEDAADAAASAATGSVEIPAEKTGLPSAQAGGGGAEATGGGDAGGEDVAAYGGQIGGTGVRLRSAPDNSSNDNVIAMLGAGTAVEVTDDASQREWVQVQAGGQTGWVHRTYVTRAAQGQGQGQAQPQGQPQGQPQAQPRTPQSNGAPAQSAAARRAAGARPQVPIDAAPVSGRFLGTGISAHPTLVWRLARAEAHLESQFNLSGAALRTRLQVTPGYSVLRRNDAYHHFALAIDINYSSNPYVGGQGGRDAPADREALAAVFRACLLTGLGEPLSPSVSWARHGGQGSTDALYTYFDASNRALQQYLAAAENPAQISQWITAGNLRRALTPPREVPAAALRADELRQADATAWQAAIRADLAATHGAGARRSNWWMSGAGRQRSALGFMNLDRDLVVALRDIGGLAWGASDFGGGANGDFMHFDCRHDFSRAQLQAGMAAPVPATP